ncbi:MAG: hypothetical protein IJS15_05520 [Victivallales bacterium]|nr:hypothetical protein [Victivallales bacterium]
MTEFNGRNANRGSCLIMGLGHTGCRVLESLAILKGYSDIDSVAIDTDSSDLSNLSSLGVRTLLLGSESVGRHGTGGDQEQAMHIIMDAHDAVRKELAARRMLILVAALGGGIGGAAEEILKLADECLLPTVFLAVMPFYFEPLERRRRAEELLSQMDSHCQILVRVPNDKLLSQYAHSPAADAFGRAADYLAKAAVCLATPFASENLFNVAPGIFNSMSAMDGNPRCLLAHVVCDSSDGMKDIKESLGRQYVFEDKHLIKCIDRGVALLRLSPSCKESEMDFAVRQAMDMLPDAEIEVAVCVDREMTEFISMTLLLHPSQTAYAEEDEESEVENVAQEGDSEAESNDVQDDFMLPEPEMPAPPSKHGRGKNVTSRQLQIQFEEDELGVFAGDPKNEWNGSNIDIPVFKRLKITIDKGT